MLQFKPVVKRKKHLAHIASPTPFQLGISGRCDPAIGQFGIFPQQPADQLIGVLQILASIPQDGKTANRLMRGCKQNAVAD